MPNKSTFVKETESLREMRALEMIEENPSVSQREIADRLGVAVGVANACIRTLARKGLVKIRGENNRSLTYHLTKAGLLHKSRLAIEWTRNTIDFYRQARTDVARRLTAISESGVRRVILVGSPDLTEIAILVAPEAGLDVLAVAATATGAAPSVPGVAVVDFGRAVSINADALVFCAPYDADERLRAVESGARVIDLWEEA